MAPLAIVNFFSQDNFFSLDNSFSLENFFSHCLELPYWHYQLVLSWYPHQPESHQLSLTNVSLFVCLFVCDIRTQRSDPRFTWVRLKQEKWYVVPSLSKLWEGLIIVSQSNLVIDLPEWKYRIAGVKIYKGPSENKKWMINRRLPLSN